MQQLQTKEPKTRLRIEIDQHLKRCTYDIYTILKSGRNDLDAIAIVLTEAFFRGRKIRILEFLIFKIFKYLRYSRANTISLGMAQVQARHWRIPITLFRILSPITAYDVTMRYWHENGLLSLPLSNKIAKHVGELRYYYYDIAVRCHDRAQYWVLHLADKYPISSNKEG